MGVSESLFKRLSAPLETARTEADIQSDIRTLLLVGDFDLDAPRLEEQIGDGTRRRIDVATGATVIEVKRQLTNEQADADFISQLHGYVRTRMSQDGSRYNGILTDGRSWWLYEVDPAAATFARRSTFELTTADKGDDLVEWLQAVLATRHNVRPTQTTIETMLGADSPAYRQDVAYLESLYNQVADEPMVGLKRQLWARLLRSALGTNFDNQTRLFIDHTLLVIEASAIGHAVMGLSLEDLITHPEQLLSGEEFRQAGIYNVIEPGFFDWVLLAGDEGRRFLTRIVHRIAVFDWASIDHDVLKILYESIINPESRKSMGEYYTPDWLAEGIVDKALTDPLTQSALDPACGSGTFVFQAIRRIARAAEEAGWSSAQTVEHIQNHVFGLDIHPVSVMLARVTYLLALGELLQDRGDIWVPVHLGDSMQWFQPGDHDENVVRINTDGADLAVEEEDALFSIGRTLAFPLDSMEDTDTFDQLVTAMTDRAKEHTDSTQARPQAGPILRKFGIGKNNPDYVTLEETFNLLCDLNAEGRDSIWGFYVRNQVRPLWLSMEGRRVDVLIGNPPWVAYRFMTPDMQGKYKAFAEKHGIWEGREVATHQDLVALFIVRSVEKYLVKGGSFNFVTPLAVLSRKAYDGFRTGEWGRYLRGEVTELWDLEKIRPAIFPVPSAVIFGRKHIFDPRAYQKMPPSGFPKVKKVMEGLRDKDGWEKTWANLTVSEDKNIVISSESGVRSVYNDTVSQGANLTPRMMFFVVEGDASASKLGKRSGTVPVVSQRGKLDKAPWKELPDLTGVLPSKFIFDVHLGSTTAPFRLLDPWRAVLPVAGDKLMTESEIDAGNDRLRAWWNEAAELWEENRTKQSKLSLLENLNYQQKMIRQLGATKHRVVYSASGVTVAAARLEDPRIIVEHALYWMPAGGLGEARYLTAILNAPATTELISVYQSRGLFGARHFDKNVWRLPIPKYDPHNDLHVSLVTLAEQAEEIASQVDVSTFGFQTVRKLIRTELETAGLQAKLDEAVRELLGEG
ncbi:N-6 DNA Methylase (plasmid) [Corynebacterium atrinae]|nr:N-6 DNA Methylase [Corynebacterium atrinae]